MYKQKTATGKRLNSLDTLTESISFSSELYNNRCVPIAMTKGAVPPLGTAPTVSELSMTLFTSASVSLLQKGL